MAKKPPAMRKPRRSTATGYRPDPPPAAGEYRSAAGLPFRVAGIEARVKAEARIANERITKLEERVSRMAAVLRDLLAERSNPSDSEDE